MTRDKVAVVCHDAGGAELVSSYVLRNNLSCTFCLEGPAQGVFGRKLGELDSVVLEKSHKSLRLATLWD